MSLPILLSVFAIPSICIPFVYLAGKKSPKAAAFFVAAIAVINMAFVVSTVPTILNNAEHRIHRILHLDSNNVTTLHFTLFLRWHKRIYCTNQFSAHLCSIHILN